MNEINIAIVEDDSDDMTKLKEQLIKYAGNNGHSFCIHHYESGEVFLNSPESFQLVFMDIELPGINGIETSRRLRERNCNEVLVLVTNMVQYAIHGYSVNAVDYVLKPVTYDQLLLKMPVYLSLIRRKQKNLIIKQKNTLTKIDINDIRFIEVFDHEVSIHLENEKIQCHKTLKEFEDELSDSGFVRCSQSCLVNLNYVQNLSGDNVTVDGHQIQMSRREKKNFSDAFIRFEKEW